ncbi:MAG: hypothetical protein V1702_03735 [Candidatus Woesearchaeota archaeon]
MTVEWTSSDKNETLAHTGTMELSGKKANLLQHALTHSDYAALSSAEDDVSNGIMVISAENLSYQTFSGVGTKAAVTDALFARLQAKMTKHHLNLAYTRISNYYETENGSVNRVTQLNDLQASALVGLQLDLNASGVLVPLPNEIEQKSVFDRILERTENEIKTFKADKEIIGTIPKTENLDLINAIVKEYVKRGIRHFAMDFCASPIPRAHIRTAVRAIREHLKIKRGEVPTEKQYTFHVLNAPTSVKSSAEVTPVTDLLTHAYGIDTTSGVIWGGGILKKENLRWYNTPDYGAYRLGAIKNYPDVHLPARIDEGSPQSVYNHLRVARIKAYKQECKVVSARVNEEAAKGYAPYLWTKNKAEDKVRNVLLDVKEIKAI